MAEILATKTSLPGYERPGTFEAVRAGALFASTLQPSGSHSPGQIRRAVAATLQRLGVRGCTERVAVEFGDRETRERLGLVGQTADTPRRGRSAAAAGEGVDQAGFDIGGASGR